MSIEIIEGEREAAMFCNTSDWAFGPVAYGDNAADRLLAFCEWLPKDARLFADHELESKWAEFLATEPEDV